MKENLNQFLELMNLTSQQEKKFLLLFDTEKDVQYFVDEVLSQARDICAVDVLLGKMREYKMRTCSMDLNMFLCTYKEEPVQAIQKLFRHSIEENEIRILEESMEQNSISIEEIYLAKKVEEGKGFYPNVWQLAL
ncbi:hypothetical protein CON15_19740 [Bacillus cereus]|uniref:Uncharacterized protein n=1 Tax=Bacillus thuringiensis TaxID=1428 RepID=A0A9X6U558_BACTU|nr:MULTISPECIES: hypothetical protein [Bacillus cereus group]MDO6628849.1 hypothetical protein [Bacillus thuringiensis]MDO6659231.1 hypothetical protein [Bacillus thuringiensis]MDO6698813.1 hypothetical protein [Bacillus thuringiensis]MEB9467836.1 hypothetical protein [Bacillus cereus]MEC0031144.1 hypothetical protein [Bacillus cereus]